MERNEVIADLHEARNLMPEVPPRWTPQFLIQWREDKARKILTALLNDPTPTAEIKGSIRRALSAVSRHDKRTELTVAISKATGVYLMGLSKVEPKRRVGRRNAQGSLLRNLP
jgi:hypothetical protein